MSLDFQALPDFCLCDVCIWLFSSVKQLLNNLALLFLLFCLASSSAHHQHGPSETADLDGIGRTNTKGQTYGTRLSSSFGQLHFETDISCLGGERCRKIKKKQQQLWPVSLLLFLKKIAFRA